MLSTPDDAVVPQTSQEDVTTVSLTFPESSQLQSDPYSSHEPVTTPLLPLPKMPIMTQLLVPKAVQRFSLMPRTRTQSLTDASPTTTKLPTLITATEKRLIVPSTPRRHRPILLIGALVSSVVILILVSLFVTPLDDGQHQQSIVQALNQFIFTGSLSPFNPAQRLVVPTSTSDLVTSKGYCGGGDLWSTCATEITASGVMGTGQMQHPLVGAVITQFFNHPEYQLWCGCWRPHTGIDLAAPYGTPIMAADSGQVIWTGWDWSGLGWAVRINHGHSISTIYGHMARFIVSAGQSVTKGDVIGYEGSTGASTGPHLHFMVLVNNTWVDPTNYVALP